MTTPAIPELLLVVDLEATCDEHHRIPRAEMEVIEIGAVLVEHDGVAFRAVDEFETFVQPRKHRRLTSFCTKLTSITQDDVDRAPRFREAIDLLAAWLDGRRPVLASWGAYDREQLAQDAAAHGVVLPLDVEQHLNLKQLFAERQGVNLLAKHVDARTGDYRKLGVVGALRRVGYEFMGTHHRGIDDARNIVRLLPWCFAHGVELTDEEFRGALERHALRERGTR